MTSDDLGGFWLSFFFDWTPLKAAVLFLMIGFVAVNLLMGWEGYHDRQRMRSFWVNNGLLIPVYAGLTVAFVHQVGPADRHLNTWWHWVALLVPFVGWVLMDCNHFTTTEYFSPSKLWHTLSSALVVYLLVLPLPLFATKFSAAPVLAIGAILCLVAFVLVGLQDRPVRWVLGGYAPIHLEGGWRPGSGRPASTNSNGAYRLDRQIWAGHESARILEDVRHTDRIIRG